MNPICFSTLIVLLSLSSLAAETSPRSSKPLVALDGEISDRDILASLTAHSEKMLKDQRATTMADLVLQLDRQRCNLKLPKPGRHRLSAEEANDRCRAGVLVVAQPYKCTKCERMHCQLASGFMITADGAFCTSYHVMSNRSTFTMIILTGDGRIAPVREVLAANRDADLVILRAEGLGFRPLPLATNAPVGSIVRVISHPNNHFYSLTEGIASRHFTFLRNRKPVSMLAITADFAKGSSAPVLNETGAVVASVNSTMSSYYAKDDDGHQENLQMVFKNCVSSRHILELIRAE